MWMGVWREPVEARRIIRNMTLKTMLIPFS
jgi:hypothetical protein